jgi:hypothetical protein
MSEDIRKMIDKVKNFKQFVNENEQHDDDSCEYCGYVYQKSTDKLLHKDIIDMLKNGLSDAFIEAKLYGKYKYKFSMRDINNMIDKAKEHLSKSEGNF